MSQRQIAIDFTFRPTLGRADFVVSASNAEAMAEMDRWPDWPSHAVALYGPAACGKTHLLHVWRERSGALLLSGGQVAAFDLSRGPPAAVAVDSADTAAEEPLLHLCNAVREGGGGLVLAARLPPASWATRLPDLASRLKALPAIGIRPPDDSLLAAVLAKHFTDRQQAVPAELIDYLVRRIERSFAAAAAIAADLDRAALAARRSLTVALARELLSGPDDRSERSIE